MGLVITSEDKPAKVDGGSYYTPPEWVWSWFRKGAVISDGTPLTLRDLSDLFPSREWATPEALGNSQATIFVILKS
jgi:hypothetical protein